jgi:hypothetical protein
MKEGERLVTMAVETRRRVKVYSFGENLQWEDMGTGHVSMDFVERNQVLTIIVRSEDDGEFKFYETAQCVE